MREMDDLKFEIHDEPTRGTRIKVIGVGGAGCNAVSRMMESGVEGVEFHVLNTDVQALKACPVPSKLALGPRITQGLGAGSDPEVGRQAALEDTDRIIEMLEGAEMVFVAAGLGGGTGTGAAPVVCSLAKELNALTVAVVTRPFLFEGSKRRTIAEAGLADLASTVDCVISIPNDRLVQLLPRGTSFQDAFRLADDVLRQGVQGISDVMTTPGLINLDFADVRAIMSGMGFAMMGSASARGEGAAVEAARKAMDSPLLEDGGLHGAKAVLLNITASGALTIHDLADACDVVRNATGNADVPLNFGLVPRDEMGDEVRITVIATGFERKDLPAAKHTARDGRKSSLSAVNNNSRPVPSVLRELPAEPEPVFTHEQELAFQDEPEAEPAPAPAAPPPPVLNYVEEEGFEFEDVETPALVRRRS